MPPMSESVSIWDKLTRLVVCLVVIAVIIGIGMWYRPVIEDNRRKRAYKLELEQRIQAEKITARKLESASRSMQDPKTIERMARERLNYAKPGENVIHFESITN